MRAVDTNVIVRLLTADDRRQSEAAKTLFASGPIWIAKTVLLETAWVLESVYGFKPVDVQDALAKLLGLANVNMEDQAAVAAALALARKGLDFANAMHLVAGRPPGAAFVSFDQSFIRRAARAGIGDIAVIHR